MESVISGFCPTPPSQFAASRTRARISSSGAAAASFARGRTVVRSRVKNETSASGSAPASAPELLAMPADWASIFCALKAGMFADSSETVSDRLPATRMKGRTRTISRLPLARVVVETRITSRAAFASPGGGSRSALRVMLATRSAMLVAVARSVASTRSGTVAKLVSPSSAAKTAPPIRAAPQSPVRMVPLNHCTEMRRRSTSPPVSPSTDSGGSSPSSMRSASRLERKTMRRLPWSKVRGPLRPRAVHHNSQVRNATATTAWRAEGDGKPQPHGR